MIISEDVCPKSGEWRNIDGTIIIIQICRNLNIIRDKKEIMKGNIVFYFNVYTYKCMQIAVLMNIHEVTVLSKSG